VRVVDYPEMNFLLYLLDKFIEMNDLDKEVTVKDLYDKLNEEMTPIGGG
jgi:hypothetical protein